MAERQMPGKVVYKDYICDACDRGLMHPTGMMLTSNPPQWPHVCANCGAQKNLLARYPTFTVQPDESAD